MPDVSTQDHWAANPINPHDVNYDGDSDGWYDRKSVDIPAEQGTWDERNFVASGVTIQPGPGSLPFTNLMEWNNNTRPDLNDTDGDSVTYITQVANGLVISHQIDYNLKKYG